jgi:hydrogenase maturation factor
MGKTKTIVTVNVTEIEANEALGKFSTADSRVKEINAKLELDITDLRKKQAASLALEEGIKKDTMKIIQAYAVQNKETLFVDKKSLELQHGTIGFRTNPHSVRQFKGVKAETSIELMRKSKVFADYVVTKTTYSIDKEALIKDREDKKIKGKLADVFLEIDQDEVFFIDPKCETVTE